MDHFSSVESVVKNNFKYSQTRHSVQERLAPPIYHSRYVHLRNLNKNILNIIKKHVATKNDLILADFGCGEAPYQDLLINSCREYISIDLPGNPKATHFVDPKTNRTAIRDAYCDIVWSIQVLEHVENYYKYLLEAKRILKPGGLIIASTHGQWKFHPDPIDFWRWTSAGLKETFVAMDFEVVDFSGSLSFLSTSVQLFQDACLLSFPGVKVWRLPFCLCCQLIMLGVEKYTKFSKTLDHHRNIDSDVYFVVAKKKVL